MVLGFQQFIAIAGRTCGTARILANTEMTCLRTTVVLSGFAAQRESTFAE
jgi:hypothetical protein